MPSPVDHDVRRRQVTRIAADLVATGGVQALTTRNVAAAAGTSTTVVSHYFADKRDLVLSTYREVRNRVTARLDAAEDAENPLVSALSAYLPLDEDRRRDWRLLFAFTGLAATDPDLAREQRERSLAARRHLRGVLDKEVLAGRLATDLDTGRAARDLLSGVLGIGMQALFDPDRWPAAEMEDAVGTAVRGLVEASAVHLTRSGGRGG